jgi:hypothetical protein
MRRFVCIEELRASMVTDLEQGRAALSAKLS